MAFPKCDKQVARDLLNVERVTTLNIRCGIVCNPTGFNCLRIVKSLFYSVLMNVFVDLEFQ